MWISTAIIYGLLFLYLAKRQPTFALCFIYATLPVYLIRFSLAGIPITLLEIMIIAITLATTPLIFNQRKKLLEQKIILIALAVLAVATVSMILSPELIKALGIWKAYFIEPFALLLVTLVLIDTPAKLNKLIKALGLGALAICLFGFWQWTNSFGVPPAFLHRDGTVDRLVSFFGYPNAVGLYLAPIIMLYSAWLFDKTTIKLWWYKALVIISSFIAIVMAESEGAMLSVIGLLVVLALWYQRTRLITIISLIAGLAIVILTPIKAYLMTKLTLGDYSGSIRLLIWQETWAMIKDHPIVGAGLAGYQTMIVPYHAKTFEIFLYPHNIVLNFWSELGIVGLAVMLLLIGYHLYQTGRLVWRGTGPTWLYLAAGLMMAQMLIHGLVDAPYFKNDLAIIFWLAIALPVIGMKFEKIKESV